MYKSTYPDRENVNNDSSRIYESNNEPSIAAQEIAPPPPVLEQPQSVNMGAEPVTKTTQQTQQPTKKTTQIQTASTQTIPTQEEFVDATLKPSKYTTYTPGAEQKANDIFSQSLLDYKNAITDQSIKDRSKIVSDYFKANYPDQNKAMENYDERLKGGMFARAFSDLGNAVGGAIGNTGGRANIQQQNYSPFENDLANYKNAVAQRGARQHQKAVAEFEQSLNQISREQQELSNRDASAISYGQKARDKYLDNNKITFDNSADLNSKRILNTNEQKALDRKQKKELNDANNIAANKRAAQANALRKQALDIQQENSKNSKGLIIPNPDPEKESRIGDETFAVDILRDVRKINPNATKIKYQAKDSQGNPLEGVYIYREPKNKTERQQVLINIAEDYPKQYGAAYEKRIRKAY